MVLIIISIMGLAASAGWVGFVLAHRPHQKAARCMWQRQIELTRLLIQMQPKH